MEKYNLQDIVELLFYSKKWIGIVSDNKENPYITFNYIPKSQGNKNIVLKIYTIPEHGKQIDLSKPFVAEILRDDYFFITLKYVPEGNEAQFTAFTTWLNTLVTRPDELLDQETLTYYARYQEEISNYTFPG